MKCILITVLISVVSDAYVINYKTLSPITRGVYDYHRTTGIPLAEQILKNEKEITIRQRITGGSVTEIDAVPYQTGLIISVYDANSICGGSIISETRILTAAHCYSDGVSTAHMITVVFGSSLLFTGGTRILTNDVVVHARFNPATVENDVAVIRVSSITFSSQIQPVALPSGDEINMDFTGHQAIASGYGMTSDEEDVTLLQAVSSVTVPVITNAECTSVYGGFIQSQHICTSGRGARGTCGGDSGGPLVVELGSGTVLIGVTSFGAEECTSSYPSAFVRVTEFINWITAQL